MVCQPTGKTWCAGVYRRGTFVTCRCAVGGSRGVRSHSTAAAPYVFSVAGFFAVIVVKDPTQPEASARQSRCFPPRVDCSSTGPMHPFAVVRWI